MSESTKLSWIISNSIAQDMKHPPGPSGAQFTAMQGNLSELSVEVIVLGADNPPLSRKLVRPKRQFLVAVAYQGAMLKLASAKFDGQTVKWKKELEAFSVRPSSPFTLRLYAKRFLYRPFLVGQTPELVLSTRSTLDLTLNLTEGQTQQVVLHLTVTVSPNAACAPISPASHIPLNARSNPSFSINPTNTIAQNARPTPIWTSSPTIRNAWNATSDPSFLSSPTDFAVNMPSTATFPPNHTNIIAVMPRSSPYSPASSIAKESGSSLTSDFSDPIASRRSSLYLYTNPTIEANGESGSGWPSNPTDSIGANLRFVPSFPTNPTSIITSLGPLQSGPSTFIIPEFEPNIDDIIQRFRILSVGRSGVGKSSLINRVFGIEAPQVQNHRPGEADIEREFVSPQNQHLVLHDSEGFEPGDLSNFETVSKFVQQRSRHEVPLSERIHVLWLYIQTPTAGGRIFEVGDKKLLQFANKHQVPIVVVFTQYDQLVKAKEVELREEYPQMDPARLREMSCEDAEEAFNVCLKSLQRTMNYLDIPMPRYARVSVHPGHQEDISELVTVTSDMVKERMKGDARVLWAAIIPEACLSLKIDACIIKGINRNYRRALLGCAPGMGQSLLRDCLRKIHRDIITCWNFKGEVLNSREFQQLILYLVQDVHPKSGVSNFPAVDVINQFVTLASSAAAPIAPPVAILGLTHTFVQWLSTTALENVPSVQRIVIAYAVNLIRVLRELFDITLRPDLALTTSWVELQVAFEAYELSHSRQRIHRRICSRMGKDEILSADEISQKVRELLQD